MNKIRWTQRLSLALATSLLSLQATACQPQTSPIPPSNSPSANPTLNPNNIPSNNPSASPSASPSPAPSATPSGSPLPSPSASSLRRVPLNEEFKMDLLETVLVADTGLQVKWQRLVSDSRCPRDVTCVWAGEAKIELQLQKGSESASLELILPVEPNKPLPQALGYSFELFEVSPYPGSKQTEDIIALTVRPLS